MKKTKATTSAATVAAEPKAPTPAPAPALKKVSLAGFATQTPATKSAKAYPLLPDPDGQVGELVTSILDKSAQVEALEGALELEKAELIAIAKPFYFAHHHGQHAIASSVEARSADGKVVRVGFSNSYRGTSDEPAITRPFSAGPYYQGVTWEGSEGIAATLRTVVGTMNKESQSVVLYEVRRHNLDVAGLNLPIKIDPLEQLLGQPDHTFAQQADLLSIVTDSARPKPMRIAAFRAALDVTGFAYEKWCIANLQALAAIEGDPELHATLGREFVQSASHRGNSINRIPKTWSKLGNMKEAQKTLFFDMVCTVAQSPLTDEKGRQTLVTGMGREKPALEFIQAIARNHALAFKGYLKGEFEDPGIARLAGETLASFEKAGGKLVGELPVAEVTKAVLAMDGNAEEGKQIFVRQSCIACHSILPDEPQKGPYLGAVGNLYNREQLITQVIDPGAEVAQGFQTYQFKLKDGSTASGFVTARDDQTVKLRDLTGASQTLQMVAVDKEEVLKGSMMPPGLVNSLTLRQFASLIDYLQTLH